MDQTKSADFVQLGAFEAARAKHVLALLEQHGVPFELELDESGQRQAGRTTKLILGVFPEGTTFLVFVSPADLPRATELIREFLQA